MLTEQDKEDMLKCMTDLVRNKAVSEFKWYHRRATYVDRDEKNTEIVVGLDSEPRFKEHPVTGCDDCRAVVRVLIPAVDPEEGKMYYIQ